MWIFKKYSLLIVTTLGLSACGNDETVETPAPKIVQLQAPIRFHRKVVEKPGLTFDVMTWGRGKDSTSALAILRSDSTKQKFSATNSEITGKPVDAWDMDLDTDGNPEIVLEVQLPNKVTDLYIYEFDRSGNSQSIRFPSLSDKAMEGFKGKDNIYVKDGNLRRDFMYQEPGNKGKPYKRTLEYSLRNNALNINEIKEEAKK